jgi:hypothetical protein
MMANKVKGKVSRMYVSESHCYIRLANIPASDTPRDGYFRLKTGHDNYNSLYSLALTAATHDLELLIRIEGSEILAGGPYPDIKYMVVDWVR